MENDFIGRKKEQEILLQALASKQAEMVAIIGRRRVGKTFLIRSVYDTFITFEVTGMQNTTLKRQLRNFSFQLKTFFRPKTKLKLPIDWLEAFQQLIELLEDSPVTSDKKVLFFDELPWLDTRKSGFLEAFGFFWNSWASRKKIVIVICGSAASWMIQKVVYDKGGLHNRITKRIDLQAFNLYETELFLKNNNVNLDRYQILHLYMAMGGIPHYLKEVEPGLSSTQNIEKIGFSANGLLKDEFMKLYPALFENAESHISIIRALANNWYGLTRKKIIEDSKLPDGGTTTRYIEELVNSGFISPYYPFGKKKKEITYRLSDEYSLFYLKFIETKEYQGKDVWNHLNQTQTYKSWSGYAFENICLKHLQQIKKALEISGIYLEASCFHNRGNKTEDGIQIDLLLDRNDNVINLCEMKFYKDKFSITKTDAEEFREKIRIFRTITQTNKQIFQNIFTTFGLIHNENSLGLIDKAFDMNILFEPD
jgi:uncharacterized protein